MADGVVEVVGSLAPNTDAWLVHNYGGGFQPHYGYGERVAEGKVDDDGSVRFEGLPVGQRYWLVGERYQGDVAHGISVTAKEPGDSSLTENLRGPRPGSAHGMDPQEIPEDRPKSGDVGPRQQDVPLDVVQRSDTPVGVATPIPAGERSPYPSQGEAGGVQSSDTEVGKHVPATTVRSGSGSGATVAGTPAAGGWAGRARWRASCSALTGEEPADVTEHDDVVPVSHLEEVPLGAEAGGDLGPRSDAEVLANSQPWPGYDDATADELKDTISRKRSVEQLEAVGPYEVANKDRSTVVAAAQARLEELGAGDEADAQ